MNGQEADFSTAGRYPIDSPFVGEGQGFKNKIRTKCNVQVHNLLKKLERLVICNSGTGNSHSPIIDPSSIEETPSFQEASIEDITDLYTDPNFDPQQFVVGL